MLHGAFCRPSRDLCDYCFISFSCHWLFFLIRYWKNISYRLGLSLLIAGTAGNVIDRIFSGHVVDMFQLDFINFPIFNCADTFLTIGIIVLGIAVLREQ